MSRSETGAGWHVAPDDLGRYVDGHGAPAVDASVESHLLACARCREALAPLTDPATLRLGWESVAAEVTRPVPTLTQRLLVRLGLPESDAVLVDAAPALRASWAFGVLVSLLLVIAAVGEDSGRTSLVFLCVAPLLPVAAVAVAHGRELDPTWEITAATPYRRLRLVLLRSVAVLATALPLTLAAAPVLEGPAWLAAAWLVPAAACVATVLALATWIDVGRAAGVVVAAWILAMVVVGGPGLHEPLLVLETPVLVLYLLVAVAASVVFWRRCDRLSVIGSYS